MKTKDHAILAGYITTNASNHGLDKHKKAFVFGSVAPDINVLTHIRGHKFNESIHIVERRFKKLLDREQWKTRDFYRFGKIIHYLADYFTFAHNTFFSGGIHDHREYEKKLHDYFIPYLDWVREHLAIPVSGKGILESVIKNHEDYMNAETSVENDCHYIVSICMNCCLALLDLYETIRYNVRESKVSLSSPT